MCCCYHAVFCVRAQRGTAQGTEMQRIWSPVKPGFWAVQMDKAQRKADMLYLSIQVLVGLLGARKMNISQRTAGALALLAMMLTPQVLGIGFYWTSGGAQMDKAQRAADMLSGALALLGEDADSAEARERLGLPPGDSAFGEEEPGTAVQRAMQQARTPQPPHAVSNPHKQQLS